MSKVFKCPKCGGQFFGAIVKTVDPLVIDYYECHSATDGRPMPPMMSPEWLASPSPAKPCRWRGAESACMVDEASPRVFSRRDNFPFPGTFGTGCRIDDARKEEMKRQIDGSNILRLIDLLRAEEGDGVTINSSNVGFSDLPNEAIDCVGDWTDWQERRFTGNTLLEALQAAADAKGARK